MKLELELELEQLHRHHHHLLLTGACGLCRKRAECRRGNLLKLLIVLGGKCTLIALGAGARGSKSYVA